MMSFHVGLISANPGSFLFDRGPRSPARLGVARGDLSGRERNGFRSQETENHVPDKKKRSEKLSTGVCCGGRRRCYY